MAENTESHYDKITHKFRSSLEDRYSGFVDIVKLYPDSWWLVIQYNTLVQIKKKNSDELITSYSKRYRIERGENYFCYGSPEKYDNPKFKSYFYKVNTDTIESVYIPKDSPEYTIYENKRLLKYVIDEIKYLTKQINDNIKSIDKDANTVKSLNFSDYYKNHH